MPRRVKCRRVSLVPEINFFSPTGHYHVCQDEVVLTVEDFEALRLKDFLNLELEESAEQGLGRGGQIKRGQRGMQSVRDLNPSR